MMDILNVAGTISSEAGSGTITDYIAAINAFLESCKN